MRDPSIDIMKGIAVLVMVTVHPFVFFTDFDALWFGDFLWFYDALAIPLFFYCFAFALGLKSRTSVYCMRLGLVLVVAGAGFGVVNWVGGGVFSSGVLFSFAGLVFLLPVIDWILCCVGYLFGSLFLVLVLGVCSVVLGGEFAPVVLAVCSFLLGYSSSRFYLGNSSAYELAGLLSVLGVFALGSSVYGVTVALMPLALVWLHDRLQFVRHDGFESLGRGVLFIYIVHHVLMYVMAWMFNGGLVASYLTIFHAPFAVDSLFLFVVLLFNVFLVWLFAVRSSVLRFV